VPSVGSADSCAEFSSEDVQQISPKLAHFDTRAGAPTESGDFLIQPLRCNG
jgi:hypothetical protein